MEAEVPASQLLTWDLRMPTNQKTRSPQPLLSPAQTHSSLRTPEWGFQPACILLLPAACLDPLRLGMNRSEWPLLAVQWTMLGAVHALRSCPGSTALPNCARGENLHSLSCEGLKPLLSVTITTAFWVQEDYPFHGRDPPGRLHADLLRNTIFWWQEPLQGGHAFCPKTALGRDQGLHTGNDCSHLWLLSPKRGLPCFLGIVFGNLPKKTVSHKPFSKITFIDITKSRKRTRTFLD